MVIEIKTGHGMHGEVFRHEHPYARSSAVGPAAGQEDFKADFAIDLTKIKYDVVKEKKELMLR